MLFRSYEELDQALAKLEQSIDERLDERSYSRHANELLDRFVPVGGKTCCIRSMQTFVFAFLTKYKHGLLEPANVRGNKKICVHTLDWNMFKFRNAFYRKIMNLSEVEIKREQAQKKRSLSKVERDKIKRVVETNFTKAIFKILARKAPMIERPRALRDL